MRPATKPTPSTPRVRARRNAVAPENPPITKNSGMTCSIQLSGTIHAVPSLALTNDGPASVTVTPTIIACSTTTALMQTRTDEVDRAVSARGEGRGDRGGRRGGRWS